MSSYFSFDTSFNKWRFIFDDVVVLQIWAGPWSLCLRQLKELEALLVNATDYVARIPCYRTAKAESDTAADACLRAAPTICSPLVAGKPRKLKEPFAESNIAKEVDLQLPLHAKEKIFLIRNYPSLEIHLNQNSTPSLRLTAIEIAIERH